MTKTPACRSHALGEANDPALAVVVLTADAHGVTLNPHSYFIMWDRLDSYPKLAEWICHLSEKNWVTTEHIRQLVAVTEQHFGWPHHYGA